MQIFGYCVLAAVVALMAFMVLRALFTRAPKLDASDYVPHPIDEARLVGHLSGAVKIPTVTLPDNDADGSIFYEYQAYIEKCYPLITSAAEKTQVNKYAVIYKVTGSDKSLLPAAILAHQDVVPAPEEGWEVPPFSGDVKDGYEENHIVLFRSRRRTARNLRSQGDQLVPRITRRTPRIRYRRRRHDPRRKHARDK